MTYADISPAMRAFLGGWEGFRNMGFRSSDLFCAVRRSAQHNGHLSLFCVLKTQGKEFNLECGLVDSVEETEAEYRRVGAAVAAGELPQADLDRIWQESEPYVKKVDFVLAVVNKGFAVPGHTSN